VLAKYTLTRSASERDLEWIAVFKSCATKSMTGSGSKKDVADISENAENEGKYIKENIECNYMLPTLNNSNIAPQRYLECKEHLLKQLNNCTKTFITDYSS
jgi:hypothetical protein